MRESKTAAAKEHTPVMLQYLKAKERYPGTVVFFRLGDFYEMFYDDAVLVSEKLQLTLTSRGSGPDGERIPMAGVPYHAAPQYLARLLKKGVRVAICEQMADPKSVRGVVPREVVRVVTPSLTLEEESLDSRVGNYLVAIAVAGAEVAVAAFELSTGELAASVVADATAALMEVTRLEPRELLCSPEVVGIDAEVLQSRGIAVQIYSAEPELVLPRHVPEATLAALPSKALRAAIALALAYAQDTQPRHEIRVDRILELSQSAQLLLDETAIRNLELVRTLSGERKGSLLDLLDETKTSMGARLLRRRLLSPLMDAEAIARRLHDVDALVQDGPVRDQIRNRLALIADIERLATKAQMRLATPRDIGQLRTALQHAEFLRQELAQSDGPLEALRGLAPTDTVVELADELAQALVDEPPANDREGGILRDGTNPEVDELRSLSSGGKDVVLELEQREKKRTGIGSLKVKYTRVFGYYIEVTRSNLDNVPSDYIRKQTIAGGERYVTEELLELQDKILSADERSVAIEQAAFAKIRERVALEVFRLRSLAAEVAALDVSAALADVAVRNGYVRPQVDDGLVLDIADGRHAIVERLVRRGEFVANDTLLSAKDGEQTMMLITGPNMAGKSTVMRQVALVTILAQMGSFVPAARAKIGLVDRIFTRVGARDDLAEGSSTFMVEMKEAAAILQGATRRSLVVLDEIGRGTSTYDGLALAWAIAEYLHDQVHCRCMFATHYHELQELASTRTDVRNFNVAAREYGEEVVFLRRLVPGGSSRSYGIAVAKLAGLEASVVERARELLGNLERGKELPSGGHARMRPLAADGQVQLELFAGDTSPCSTPGEEETLAQVRALDLNTLTPIAALQFLAQCQQRLN